MTDSMEETVACPFCAEQIKSDAVLCRYCRSSLVGEDGKRLSPADAQTRMRSGVGTNVGTGADGVSFGSALLANAFCPGLGAWKLGARVRGAAVFLLIMGCVAMYSMAYADAINAELPKAMRTGKTKALEKKMGEVAQNPWGTAGFWLYVFSFVDVWLVYPRKRS